MAFVNKKIERINVYYGGRNYLSTDVVSITNQPHDTLLLQKFMGLTPGGLAPAYLPANLDLGNLTIHGNIKFNDSDAFTAVDFGNKRIIYAHDNDDYDFQTPDEARTASIRRMTIQGGANSGAAGILVYEGLVPQATDGIAPSLGHPPIPTVFGTASLDGICMHTRI